METNIKVGVMMCTFHFESNDSTGRPLECETVSRWKCTFIPLIL